MQCAFPSEQMLPSVMQLVSQMETFVDICLQHINTCAHSDVLPSEKKSFHLAEKKLAWGKRVAVLQRKGNAFFCQNVRTNVPKCHKK